jgi:hypothetical protein
MFIGITAIQLVSHISFCVRLYSSSSNILLRSIDYCLLIDIVTILDLVYDYVEMQIINNNYC